MNYQEKLKQYQQKDCQMTWWINLVFLMEKIISIQEYFKII